MDKKPRIIIPLIFILSLFCSLDNAHSNERKVFLKDNWLLQSSFVVKEDGKKISFGMFQPEGWYPTSVPTTVLTALVLNGVYKDVSFMGNAYSWNMERVWAIKDKIRIDATSSAEIVKLKIPEDVERDVYFVELQLRDDQDSLISGNFYWLTDDGDDSFLSTLPKVKLDVELDKVDAKGQVKCYIRLENSSDTLAFFVNPSIRKGRDGEEVLPSFWSDNYFSILPGRTKELTVEFRKLMGEGTKVFLRIEGWNIVSQTIGIDL
jgi:hypothetical protein